MTTQSVNELAEAINQNQINESLLKAEALLQIVLGSELQNASTHILHDYLWVLSDLVSDARKLL